MWAHIAVLAPATRVMSRKLGPTWSVSPWAAAWEARTFARTCGRWLKTATARSCAAGSTATGRAPTSTTKRCSRSYRRPSEFGSGHRYHAAPWNRSARACSTPAVSAPAIGWPPTKRGSSTSASRLCFVEPTSVTAQPGPAAASAPTGAQAKQSSAPSTASATEPASRPMAPRSSATRSRSGSRPYPTTSTSSTYSRAARPIEPPISPTPRTAMRTRSDRGQLLARELRGGLELPQVIGELLRAERLRAVADRLLGAGVHLDDHAVGAGRRGGQRERLDEAAPARRVGRVHDDRQVGELAQYWHRHQVEREAVARLVGADPALAQHDVRVALLEDVLRRHQELLERRRQPALQQHWYAGATDLGEQRVVLHAARAELDHVGHLEHGLHVAHVQELGHDRQAGLLARLGQQAQAGLAEALERVRRRARLVGAAAQQLRARVLHGVGRLEHHLARLDRARAGDRGEVVAAYLATVDLDDGPLVAAVLERRELVGLQDRHQVVHTRRTVQPEVGDVLAIPDRANHGHQLALGDVGVRAYVFDALDDGGDLRLRRPLFHDNHHVRPRTAWQMEGTTRAGVRRGRLAKSPRVHESRHCLS